MGPSGRCGRPEFSVPWSLDMSAHLTASSFPSTTRSTGPNGGSSVAAYDLQRVVLLENVQDAVFISRQGNSFWLVSPSLYHPISRYTFKDSSCLLILFTPSNPAVDGEFKYSFVHFRARAPESAVFFSRGADFSPLVSPVLSSASRIFKLCPILIRIRLFVGPTFLVRDTARANCVCEHADSDDNRRQRRWASFPNQRLNW